MSISQAHDGRKKEEGGRDGEREGERQLSHNVYRLAAPNRKVHAQLSSQSVQVFFFFSPVGGDVG